jgi:hypothetical protein
MGIDHHAGGVCGRLKSIFTEECPTFAALKRILDVRTLSGIHPA